MIDSHQVQHRGVEIVDFVGLFNRSISKLIGRTDDGATLHAATRHPNRIAEGIVISTV